MNIHCKYDSLVEVGSLKPHPKNRNKHPDDQIERLAKILKYQGVRAPIVVSRRSNKIVKGHGTLQAIKANQWDKAPVVYQDFEDDDQEWLFVQSDNAIASWAELDLKGINADIGELGPFDIDLIGIKDFVVEPAEKDLGDEEAVPDVRETNIKLGDLFTLGDHRLLCGDSTNSTHVERLMNKEKADMVFTDPPYGVDYEGISNDHLKEKELSQFIFKALSAIDPHLKEGSCYYIWHPDIHSYEFVDAVRKMGWKQARPSTVIWVKDSLILSPADYNPRHEPCLFGWKAGKAHMRVEDRTETTVWEFPKPKRSEKHPTMKPIEICEKAIKNSSKPGVIVVDLFLGSGSTMIACEKTNRKCYGLELEPKYCQVIIDRWEQYTGKKAVKHG